MDERFWIRLTGLGFGSRPRLQANIGSISASANVRQDVVLLECAAWLRTWRIIRPMGSLGIGTLRLATNGTAGMPYQGEHHARWFFAADAGAGFAVRLGEHWQAQLEAHALFAEPRPAIRFLDADTARAGQPTLLAILTLAGGA
jgi:alkanesulfonate monooxygenase SsuD/methylene tetrahydromethanopterin reductase-like flavin-dependent oxidoreductase (luciferase family)